MNKLLRKIWQDTEKSPSKQKLSMVWQWNRIERTKKLPKNEWLDYAFREKNQSICCVVVLTYRFTDCITAVSHPNLREVFGLSCIGTAQRKEDGLFLFSQVQSFQNGVAHQLRSECAEVESKGDYRFKIVKLHVALVGYAYGSLYLVLP